MEKYFDLEKIINSCDNIESIESKRGGKSGKVMVFKVNLDVPAYRFLDEISENEYYPYIAVMGERDDSYTVYVLKMVDDLFNYLMDNGAFDDFEGMISDAMDMVRDVVDSLKEDQGTIDINFYYNDVTPEWFWNNFSATESINESKIEKIVRNSVRKALMEDIFDDIAVPKGQMSDVPRNIPVPRGQAPAGNPGKGPTPVVINQQLAKYTSIINHVFNSIRSRLHITYESKPLENGISVLMFKINYEAAGISHSIIIKGASVLSKWMEDNYERYRISFDTAKKEMTLMIKVR